MIISTGVDLVEVERIRAALEDPRIGTRFRDRVFTENEIAYCEKKQRGKYESYAGRFAAKEAFSKAMGTGFRYPVTLGQIIVLQNRLGKPELSFRPDLQRLVESEGIVGSHVTISDEKSLACAVVVLERR